MRFTDLVTGLSLVAGHVGLAKLDSGLRSSLDVPLEQLQSHVQLVTRAAQATMITGQIDQLRGQANKFQKQQLNAQHAQLMVQIGQLQLQLQQYEVERKRLELELAREKRQAQENQLLRIYVDLFNEAQIFRQTARYLDFIYIVTAAYRIYKQVYHDLDDANNRLRLAELRERLLEGSRDVLSRPEARRDMSNDFVTALQMPVGLIHRGRQAVDQAGAAMVDSQSLRLAPQGDYWMHTLEQSSEYSQRLQTARHALNQVAQEHTAFSAGDDPRELFLATDSAGMAEFVASLGADWLEWRKLVELKLGRPVSAIAGELVNEPRVLDVKTHEVSRAEEEVSGLRLSHELGLAVAAQGKFLETHKRIYAEAKARFDETPMPPIARDAVTVFESRIELRQLGQHLDVQVEEYLRFVDTDRNLRDKGYIAAAIRRLEMIKAQEASRLAQQAADMAELSASIQALQAGLDRIDKLCKESLDKAVDDEATFMRVREAAQARLGADTVLLIEVEQAGTSPGVGARLKSLFRNDHGKEVDQRRRLIAALVDRIEVVVEDPPQWNPPRLPDLPEYRSSRSGRSQ